MIDVSPDLLAFLQEEEVRSRNTDLLDRAEACLDAYNGQLYGNEEDGRSQVVTRDVAEVCDHMGVSVLRTFVSGDHVVEFEPDSEEDEQHADDATKAIHRHFARKGYQLLHDWLKEGNVNILGVVKACMERKRQRVEFITEDPERDGAIEADEIEGSAEELGFPLYKAVKLEEGKPTLKTFLIPLEEFRVSPDARDLDDAVYAAHATLRSLSELVEMGFERDDVEGLSSSADNLTALSTARDDTRSFWGDDRKGAGRKVLLLEEYVRFDADGDGIAELLCVHRVGDTVLRIEATDYQPFVAFCPFPMPGRLVGHGLAEKVTDIQMVNTTLNRLALDGLYCNLAPGYVVPDKAVNANTYDDLLHVRPNRIVRTTGNADITPEPKNDVSAIAWQAMEFMIGQRESRTGITRLNQGLDADTLNKTATGQAALQAQGQQMEEYVARNFGESVARLMRLVLKLKSRYPQPENLRVDGQFRQVDPSQWPEDMDVTIRVGLGSGRKEQRLQYRMMLLNVQKEAMMGGLPIVTAEQIYKSGAGLVKDANLGSPTDFFIDPETLKVQNPETGEMEAPPSPPSPEEQKMQAETAMQQAKIQGDQQIQAAKLQGEQQSQAAKIEAMREESALKAQLARDEASAEAELAAAKANAEMGLAERKFEFEMQMADRKLDFEERRAAREADRRDTETQAKVSANRPGGKLDE